MSPPTKDLATSVQLSVPVSWSSGFHTEVSSSGFAFLCLVYCLHLNVLLVCPCCLK
jgi:hypothetical protein